MPARTFRFFALIGYSNHETEIKRVPVSGALQIQLESIFVAQGDDMLNSDGEAIAYEANYKLEKGEKFRVAEYILPEQITAAIRNPEPLAALDLSQEMGQIKSIFAGYYDHSSEKYEVYFQTFSRSRIIRPETTLLSTGGTFRRLEEPGLVIDTGVAAVYKDGNLFFHSLAVVSRFLDLAELYSEATNEEITEVLGNGNIHVDDLEGILETADSWMRKRFTSIKENGILENISGKKIATIGKKFELDLKLKRVDGKMVIVFPDNKKDQKVTLKLLNEELFKGIMTNRNLQTNSYRKL